MIGRLAIAWGAAIVLAAPAAAQQFTPLPRHPIAQAAVDSSVQMSARAWTPLYLSLINRPGVVDPVLLRDARAAAALHARRGPRQAAMADLAIGKLFQSMQQKDSAHHYLNLAARGFLAGGDTIWLGRVLKAVAAGYPANYAEILELLKQFEPVPAMFDSALALDAAALAAYRHGQLDSAAAIYTKVLPFWQRQLDPGLAIHTLNSLGEIALARARFDSAAVWFMEASDLADYTGDWHYRGRNLNNLGIVALAAGQAQAAQHLRGGGGGVEGNIAAIINALSRIELNQPDTAFFALAGNAQRPPPAPDTVRVARLPGNPLIEGWFHLATGAVLVARGDLDGADISFNRALPLLEASQDSIGQALANAYRAQSFLLVGQSPPDSLLAVAGTYRPLLLAASTRARNLDTKAALAELKRVQDMAPETSIEAALDRELRNEMRRTTQQMREDQLPLANAYLAVGRAYESAGEVEKTAAYYDSAAMALSRVSLYFANDAARVGFADRMVNIGERAASAWLARARKIGTREAAFGALGVIERGRSIAFQYLRKGAAPDTGSMITSFGRNRPKEKETDAGVSNLSSFGAVSVGEGIARDVFRGYDDAALNYFYANDTLTTWLITRNLDWNAPDEEKYPMTLHRQRVPVAKLAELIAQVRSGLNVDSAARNIEDNDPLARAIAKGTAWQQALADISDIVLPAEIRAALPDSGGLIVVPHGTLAQVPFTALPFAGRDTLIADRFDVRYGLSMSALLMSYEDGSQLPRWGVESERDSVLTARRAWLSQAMVVGDPIMPEVTNSRGQRVPLKPLAGARAEAESIAQLLGTTPLPRPAATETAFKQQAKAASIIHLATHGFAYGDPTEHVNSFVALAASNQDDGLLTVGELLRGDARLENADLVALSACQTGLGHIAESEGTLGLQRAFLARGARSVLVSLWSVDDRATGALMRAFYEHWINDADQPGKAEALRRAQKDLRGLYPNPRYWAAFQLFGAN